MIERVDAIYKRIEEIQSRFQKMGQQVSREAPAKSFESHLREHLDADIMSKLEDFEKTFVPNPSTDTDFVKNMDSANELYSAIRKTEGANTYANRVEQAPALPNVNPNTPFDSIISRASRTFGVPEALVKAVIKQESNYRPDAVSRKGAAGLMQIMPSSARAAGVPLDKLMEPETNIMTGTRMLSNLLERYDGNKENALAAYNAGSAAVDRAGGIPNIGETQNYVPRVLEYFRAYEQFVNNN